MVEILLLEKQCSNSVKMPAFQNANFLIKRFLLVDRSKFPFAQDI